MSRNDLGAKLGVISLSHIMDGLSVMFARFDQLLSIGQLEHVGELG